MLKILLARAQQGHRTAAYPDESPLCPTASAAGRPSIRPAASPTAVRRASRPARPMPSGVAAAACSSISAAACSASRVRPRHAPKGRVAFTAEYRLAASRNARGLWWLRRAAGVSSRARAPSASPRVAAAVRPVAQAAPGERRRLQRLRGRRERARHGRLRPRPVRHPVRGLTAPRRRAADHRRRSREHASRAQKDLRGRPCAEDRHRRRRLRHLGRPVPGHPEVHNGADAIVPGGPLRPGVPAAPLTILDGLLRLLGRIPVQPGVPNAKAEVSESVRQERLKWGTERAEQALRLLGADLGRAPGDKSE